MELFRILRLPLEHRQNCYWVENRHGLGDKYMLTFKYFRDIGVENPAPKRVLNTLLVYEKSRVHNSKDSLATLRFSSD